jgi:PPOX class probable FMN-dependent enzyme
VSADPGPAAEHAAEACVADLAELGRRYREPHPLVLDKVVDRVDRAVGDFLAQAPLFMLATTDGVDVDVSPRGGPAGFVRVLDERRVAFGDLSGNNRLDSYRNLVVHPAVGMLFLVPGLAETVRINGRASVVTEPALRERCAIDGRTPKVAVVVEVHECFLHCGKAFRRGGVWEPETWPAAGGRPSAGAIVKDHLALDVDAATIEADLDAGYRETLWEPGGA